MTDDLAYASAAELAALVARRALSPVEIVERDYGDSLPNRRISA